ncbi:pro-sigmaK processing inhibitor BofA family protein [Heyndrickxia acidicola]|uniref:Pro-sigmaK processing inhibitor BofA family protein n=1 Tax=Heyndrickxia acidicola TaxID=209389 RepID=A0ABU6MN13_9BACI|nr:pro-sigmaK processing inhibitor BofA family protein [Heyndrickxia acidicola]MED1206081.1 pro-sigmaK processing inhibitor BofA family protein [Heyndrickxia acidicola]
MNPTVVIAGIIGLILILLLAGSKGKPLKLVGQISIRLIIGAIFLFFLNQLGGQFGIHVPINGVTTCISGFLGIPGVIGLTIIQTWILNN